MGKFASENAFPKVQGGGRWARKIGPKEGRLEYVSKGETLVAIKLSKGCVMKRNAIVGTKFLQSVDLEVLSHGVENFLFLLGP